MHSSTYAYGWNADCEWEQNDVEESQEASDPEREDDQNDQPDDRPENISHFQDLNRRKKRGF